MSGEDDLIRRAAESARKILDEAPVAYAVPEPEPDPEAVAPTALFAYQDDLEEALSTGHTVFVARNTEIAERYRAMNFIVTAFNFSLDEVGERRAEIFNMLTDADVVILQGEHAYWNAVSKALALDLYGTAKRVRVVNTLAHGKPQTAEELIAVIEATPDVLGVRSVEPADPVWQNPSEESGYLPAQNRSFFGAVFFNTIRQITSSYGWAIKKVLALAELTLMFGESGSGKSFDLIDMGMCIARGVDFKGFKTKKGIAIIVAGEAQKGMGRRLLAYRKHHNIPIDENVPFIYLTSTPNLFLDPEAAPRLIQEIKWIAGHFDLPLVLVGFDTLSSMTAGMNEINGADVAIVKTRLTQIAQATGAAVAVTHHKPKNGAGPRGHGSLTADFEATIEYIRHEKSYGSEGPAIHSAIVRKQREEAGGITWSFQLPQILLGSDEDGDKITSCVSVEYERPEATRATGPMLKSDQQKAIFRAIMKLSGSHGTTPPPRAKAPDGTRAIRSQDLMDYCQQKATVEEGDPKRALDRIRKGVERAEDRFLDLGIIDIWNAPPGGSVKSEKWIWLTGKWPAGFGPPRIPPKPSSGVSEQPVHASPIDLSEEEARMLSTS